MSSVRALLWALRLAWAALVPAMAPAIGAALDGVSDPVHIVAQAGLWAAWAVVLLATLIPLPAALTVARLGAPGAPAVAFAAAIGGAGPLAAAVAVAVALLATVLVFTAEVGGWFVQGGA